MLFKKCIIITMKIKDFHQTVPERLRVMHVTMKIKNFYQTMPERLRVIHVFLRRFSDKNTDVLCEYYLFY